jgi:hypothetical protein
MPGDSEHSKVVEVTEVTEEEEEVTEEEEEVLDQIVAHPTRDDWHEQRERNQTSEAWVHARSTIRLRRTRL